MCGRRNLKITRKLLKKSIDISVIPGETQILVAAAHG
jgi:hypothetical protein